MWLGAGVLAHVKAHADDDDGDGDKGERNEKKKQEQDILIALPASTPKRCTLRYFLFFLISTVADMSPGKRQASAVAAASWASNAAAAAAAPIGCNQMCRQN